MEPASAIVSNAGLPDVIAYVWYQLGYQPRDSLILIGVHEPEHRLGAITRSDLPGPHARRSLVAADVRSLAATLASAGADQVIALLCATEVLRPPEPALVRVLSTELPRAGLRVIDVIGLGGSGYRSLLCHDQACCPRAGLPLDGVLATRTAATEVLFGRTLAPSEAALIADVRPTPPAGDEAGEHEQDEQDEQDEQQGEPTDAGQQLWSLWAEQVQAGTEPSPGVSRALARSLAQARMRDAVLLLALGGPASQCEAVLHDGRASRGTGWFDSLLAQVLERCPAEGRLGAAQQSLAAVARSAPSGQRGPVLAILAVLAWFEGSGVRARLLTEQALIDRPEYPLALLVQDLLVHAVAPPWARRASPPAPPGTARRPPDTQC